MFEVTTLGVQPHLFSFCFLCATCLLCRLRLLRFLFFLQLFGFCGFQFCLLPRHHFRSTQYFWDHHPIMTYMTYQHPKSWHIRHILHIMYPHVTIHTASIAPFTSAMRHFHPEHRCNWNTEAQFLAKALAAHTRSFEHLWSNDQSDESDPIVLEMITKIITMTNLLDLFRSFWRFVAHFSISLSLFWSQVPPRFLWHCHASWWPPHSAPA